MNRRKHKKHKRQRKDKGIENGTEEKVITNAITHKDIGMNGKTRNSVLEVVSTEESEDEKLVDLDSDEVDCTIIEDDIDLEELMKQKVCTHVDSIRFDSMHCLFHFVCMCRWSFNRRSCDKMCIGA
jgi:hypothetical protein